MFSGRKLPLTLAFAGCVALAIGVSCNGFFVDPTLTSLAISPPTPTIAVTNGTSAGTQQFNAVGTFNDGSTGNVSAAWTSSAPTTVASISSSGLATAIGAGSATITATSTKFPGISGTTTLTVVPANVTAITVTPSSQSVTTSQGFTLTAKDQNGNDISSSVTWTFSIGGVTETGISGTPGASGGEDFTIGTLSPPQSPPYTLSVVASLTSNGTTVKSQAVTVSVTS